MKQANLLATILLSSCLFVVGCAASASQIRAAMDPWKGRHVDALLMKWGTPTTVYETPSGEYQIYTWTYQGPTQVVASQVPSINMAFASATASFCRFDWTTDKHGTIVDYRWAGQCVIK